MDDSNFLLSAIIILVFVMMGIAAALLVTDGADAQPKIVTMRVVCYSGGVEIFRRVVALPEDKRLHYDGGTVYWDSVGGRRASASGDCTVTPVRIHDNAQSNRR